MRFITRVLIWAALTFGLGVGLWFLLLVVGFAFGASTPECADSDTCSAWGDFLYHPGPGETVCFLVAGGIAWLVTRPMRL